MADDPMTETDTPYLVALNLTRRCNLDCAHCYLDAGTRQDGAVDELDTTQVRGLIDQIARLSNETMIVLTGGEPLLRPDIYDIARHSVGHGLMTVVGTNGVLLTDERISALKQAGAMAVGVSLDSLDPEFHDRFRGVPGVWHKTMAGLDRCRAAGLMFQIHFTVVDDNAHEIDDMISFARDVGASVLNVFFVVCTGRGAGMSGISADTYEKVLARIAEAARDETDVLVRARCAPHFKRIAHQMEPPLPITLADGYDAGGCLAGTHYCRVTPEGQVTPCPYMEVSAGSVLDHDFAELWASSPLFESLRQPALEGRCGACAYARLCGGCRARPLARNGRLMGEDFLCTYQPDGSPLIEPSAAADTHVDWTPDAEARLRRVPPFVRRFVRRRAEAHAREVGATVITAAHLQALARQRFGGALKRPDAG